MIEKLFSRWIVEKPKPEPVKPLTRIELAELIQETLEAIGGAETAIQRAAARDLARQQEIEQAVKDIKAGVV